MISPLFSMSLRKELDSLNKHSVIWKKEIFRSSAEKNTKFLPDSKNKHGLCLAAVLSSLILYQHLVY